MTSDRIGQMFRQAIELDADGRGQLLATLPVSEREQLAMLLDADSQGEDSGLFESLDQEVDSPEPSSLTNKRIRDYELLEVIGEGGMGTVYRALHSRLKCDVALKVLPLNKIKQADTIARFEREMAAVGQLRHPNIVQAMDAGEERGLHYLVLEFIDGTNVAAISKSAGQLSVADACEMIRQTALGLSHAHSRGLIHRDIKPSNLLISKQGDVRIADMGLAMLQADSSDLTSAGQIMGTMDYIAPEQIEDPRHVDPRADLYSLGCTFYQLLVGRAPFDEPELGSPLKKLRAHESGIPKMIVELRKGVPLPVIDIVRQLMEKSPEDRVQSASELAESLTEFSKGAGLRKLVYDAKGVNPAVAATECMSDGSTNEDTIMPTIMLNDVPAGLQATRKRGNIKWKTPAIALGCIVAIAALALFVQQKFTVETSAGRIIVETEGRERQIAIKGETVSFNDPSDGKPVHVAVDYATGVLTFRKEGFEAFTKTVNLESKNGDKVTLRFEPKAPPTKVVSMSARETVQWALRSGLTGYSALTSSGYMDGTSSSPLPDDVSGIWQITIQNDRPGQATELLQKLDSCLELKAVSVYGTRSLSDDITQVLATMELDSLRVYCPWTPEEIIRSTFAAKLELLGLFWKSAEYSVTDQSVELVTRQFPGLVKLELDSALLTPECIDAIAGIKLDYLKICDPTPDFQNALGRLNLRTVSFSPPVPTTSTFSLPSNLEEITIDGLTLTADHFDQLAECRSLKIVYQRLAAVDRAAVEQFKIARPDVLFESSHEPRKPAERTRPSGLLIRPASVSCKSSEEEFFPVANLISNDQITNDDFMNQRDPGGSLDAWVTDGRNGFDGNAFFDSARRNEPVQLSFNFDEVQPLTGIVLWGYSWRTAETNDVQNFRLEFSTDGGETFSDPIDLTKARYEHIDNFVTPIFLDSEREANVVRMTITSNHYDSSLHGGDRVGLDEVRFLATGSQ